VSLLETSAETLSANEDAPIADECQTVM